MRRERLTRQTTSKASPAGLSSKTMPRRDSASRRAPPLHSSSSAANAAHSASSQTTSPERDLSAAIHASCSAS